VLFPQDTAVTMPVKLRRRLQCHYCGQRSAQTHLRTFKCENCEAINHLDGVSDQLQRQVSPH
jgi:primosomal protein N'